MATETNNRSLRSSFNRVLAMSVAVISSFFVCAVVIEVMRNAYAPFHGVADFKWMPNLRTFLYLMAMFNILVVRYVVMRIYVAPGPDNFETIVKRLSKAGIASMLTSELPCFYGLGLFLLAGDPVDFYLLFGLSVIYGMIYFPRYKNWVSLIEEKADKE